MACSHVIWVQHQAVEQCLQFISIMIFIEEMTWSSMQQMILVASLPGGFPAEEYIYCRSNKSLAEDPKSWSLKTSVWLHWIPLTLLAMHWPNKKATGRKMRAAQISVEWECSRCHQSPTSIWLVVSHIFSPYQFRYHLKGMDWNHQPDIHRVLFAKWMALLRMRKSCLDGILAWQVSTYCSSFWSEFSMDFHLPAIVGKWPNRFVFVGGPFEQPWSTYIQQDIHRNQHMFNIKQ